MASPFSSTLVRRWRKEEEDDVKKDNRLTAETMVLLNKFFKTVSATRSAVTEEERKAISSAYVKMRSIRRDLANRNPPPDIRECRSKIERQISGICNKLSNLTIKDSYRRHLHHFKTSSTTPQIYHQLKRKASMPQQPPKSTGTRKQNSIKAQQLQQEDTSITEENYLEKLILEEEDYDETARFIETSLRMHTTKEDWKVLFTAYENFISVYREQRNVIRSIQLDGETKEIDLHMINNHRSVIVKELSNVCHKLSNPMIREAYLHHVDEFKTGAKPKKHTQSFINQEESPEIFSEMKGGTGSGSFKSPDRIIKKPHIYDDLEEDDDLDDFHEDHNKCYEEELKRKFTQFGRNDLLHAPVNHSVKASKPRDTFPKYRVPCYELFAGF